MILANSGDSLHRKAPSFKISPVVIAPASVKIALHLAQQSRELYRVVQIIGARIVAHLVLSAVMCAPSGVGRSLRNF
jgi:hypothetical protein